MKKVNDKNSVPRKRSKRKCDTDELNELSLRRTISKLLEETYSRNSLLVRVYEALSAIDELASALGVPRGYNPVGLDTHELVNLKLRLESEVNERQASIQPLKWLLEREGGSK